MKLPLAAACALAVGVLAADPERVGLRSTAHAQQRPFDAWLQDFRSAALAGLTPLEQVIERDRAQPEFTLDFRGYLTRVVSRSRIEEGQRVLAEHGELLEKVGRRYGMPPELLAAVWGIESNYGRRQGDFPVVQAPGVRRCRARTCGRRSSSRTTARASPRSSCTRTIARCCAGTARISSPSLSAISPTGSPVVHRSPGSDHSRFVNCQDTGKRSRSLSAPVLTLHS